MATSRHVRDGQTRPALNRRQENFIAEYLVDFNASRAARAAGYTGRNAGYRLLRDERIRKRIERVQARRRADARVRADRVIAELAGIAFSDIRDFAEFDDKGVRLKPSHAIGGDAARAIAEIRSHPGAEGPRIVVKLHDKRQALVALARHLGLFSQGGGGVKALLQSLAGMAPEALEELADELERMNGDDGGGAS